MAMDETNSTFKALYTCRLEDLSDEHIREQVQLAAFEIEQRLIHEVKFAKGQGADTIVASFNFTCDTSAMQRRGPK